CFTKSGTLKEAVALLSLQESPRLQTDMNRYLAWVSSSRLQKEHQIGPCSSSSVSRQSHYRQQALAHSSRDLLNTLSPKEWYQLLVLIMMTLATSSLLLYLMSARTLT